MAAFWLDILSVLNLCFASNINCADPSCFSCTLGAVYKSKSCLDLCPSGYTRVNMLCVPDYSQSLYSLEFYKFLEYKATSIGPFRHPQGHQFDDPGRKGPVPSDHQGFFFDVSSKLVSTTSWIPAPDFSLRIGLGAFGPGRIFTITDGSTDFLRLDYIGGNLEASWLLTSNSGTITQIASMPISGWVFIMVKCIQLSNSLTLSIERFPVLSGATSNFVSTSYPGFEFRSQYSNLQFIIGNGFQGFIHEMMVDNSEISVYDSYYLFNFQGLYTDRQGTACDVACSRWPWCIRSTCNICYSTSCSLCTGFGYLSCSACSNGRTPPDCDLGLNCLAGANVFNCTQCAAGKYLIDGLCLDDMPYGYNPSQLNTPVINIVFNSFDQFIGGIFQSGDISATYSGTTFDADDPSILYNRGINFDGSLSFLVSKLPLTLNYKFTLAYWSYPREMRALFSSLAFGTMSGSWASVIFSNLDYSFKVWTSKTMVTYNQWCFTAFIIDFINNSSIITLLYNERYYIVYTISGYAIYSSNINYFYVGISHDKISSPFDGFIYTFTLWQNAVYELSTNYQICGLSISACLSTCSSLTYFDSDSNMCINCPSGCPYSCRRGTSCNICPNELCISCSSFATCTSCIANAIIINNVCQCKAGFFDSSSSCTNCNEACVLCTGPTAAACYCYPNSVQIGLKCVCNDGYYFDQDQCKLCDKTCATCYGGENYQCTSCKNQLLQNVCLDICPIGYAASNNHCVVRNNLAVQLMFTSVENMRKDLIQGFNTKIGANNNFFPDIDSFDPIPAYERGIYFTGNGSVLSYPSTSDNFLLFGVKFYISLWINPQSNTSTVIYKEYNSLLSIYVKLSNAYLIAALSLNNQSYNSTSGYLLKLNQWNHIALSITNSNATVTQFIINQNEDYKNTLTTAAFLDIINSFLQLGAAKYTTDYFQGFIYSLEIYINTPLISTLSSLICSDCGICPINNKCIPNCNITKFYNNSILRCDDCLPKCVNGCRNKDTCSLCQDELCEKCNNFNLNSCIACASPYDLNGTSCIACNTSSYYNQTLKKCTLCTGLCDGCINSTSCTFCKPNSHIISNKTCVCDQGYYLETECKRSKFNAILSVTSENIIKIIFTEVLSANLSSKDISVAINNITQTFTLEYSDSTTYSIQISFTSDILIGDKAIITFKHDIISIFNSLLGVQTISSTLYATTSSNMPSQIGDVKQYTKLGMTIAIASAFGLSGINLDPSFFFNFLNSAEIFSYVIAYEIEIHPLLSAFLNSLQIVSKIPNIFSYLLNESDGVKVPANLAELGGSSNLLLINSGVNMTIFSLIVSLIPIAWILSKIPLPRNSLILKKFWRNFKFNIFLRFYIQSCLELFYNSTISILYNDFHNQTEIIDFIVSSSIILLSVVTFGCLIMLIKKRHLLVANNGDLEEFNLKYGSIFEEFKINYASGSIYYILFVIRRYSIVLCIFAINSPTVQLCISLVFTLSILFYLIELKPFVNSITNCYMIVNETLTMLFYISLLLPGIQESQVNLLEASTICTRLIMAALAANILAGFAVSIMKIVKFIKRKKVEHLQRAAPIFPITTIMDLSPKSKSITKTKV